ncbi:MAG: class I SAM-dependent methyltransferase [Acidiferrobacterales bacterium]|nr:class I SAM-dependent methyltransferase [Acidiferrobacterales bacterium]
MVISTFVLILLIYAFIAHYVSYTLEKQRILKTQNWGLNICCGKTDGGGVNADIFQHQDLPNFKLIENIYSLPFTNKQFDSVLCSHTIEHVDDPQRFFTELQRVGEKVTIVVPPLYDIGAVLNIFEHKFIFLTFKKEHHELPPYIPLPFSRVIQKKLGQVNHA